MSRSRRFAPLALTLALAAGRALPALAQDPQPTPAPAPEATPAPAPAGPDSNLLWAGDWDFTIQLRDSTVSGAWRLNYASGRFTGIVARPGVPPSPIRSFTLRNMREFTLSVDLNNDPYTFSGRLENARNISGNVSYRGGVGRLRAQKRAS